MGSTLRLALPALAALALCAAAAPSAAAQQRVRCESHGYDAATCRVDTRGGVRLVRQLSSTRCDRGRTWGTSSQGIWVSRGCRAEFAVSYPGSYGNGGYGNGGYGNGGYGNGGYGRGNGGYGNDGRYGRGGGYGQNGRNDGYGRGGRDRDDRDDRYGRKDGGYGRGDGRDGRDGNRISSGQAAGLCRDAVARQVRSGEVRTSGEGYDSRRGEYTVEWRARGGEYGQCRVSARTGSVSIVRNYR
jgi:hypothetical protein